MHSFWSACHGIVVKKKGGWGNINRCFFIYTFMSRIPSICMQLGYKFLKHTSRYLNFSLWFKLLLIIHKISLVEDMFIVWLLSARVKFVLSNKCKFFICLSFISSLNKGRVGYSYHYVDLFAIYVLQNKSWCPPPMLVFLDGGETPTEIPKVLRCKIWHLFSKLRIYEHAP